jgi:hypothetical protein
VLLLYYKSWMQNRGWNKNQVYDHKILKSCPFSYENSLDWETAIDGTAILY